MGDQAVAKLSQLARNGKNERILDCYKKLQNSVLLQFTSYSLMLRYFNFNPSFKLRCYLARDLLGSQIPVITRGLNCEPLVYDVIT